MRVVAHRQALESCRPAALAAARCGASVVFTHTHTHTHTLLGCTGLPTREATTHLSTRSPRALIVVVDVHRAGIRPWWPAEPLAPSTGDHVRSWRQLISARRPAGRTRCKTTSRELPPSTQRCWPPRGRGRSAAVRRSQATHSERASAAQKLQTINHAEALGRDRAQQGWLRRTQGEVFARTRHGAPTAARLEHPRTSGGCSARARIAVSCACRPSTSPRGSAHA